MTLAICAIVVIAGIIDLWHEIIICGEEDEQEISYRETARRR